MVYYDVKDFEKAANMLEDMCAYVLDLAVKYIIVYMDKNHMCKVLGLSDPAVGVISVLVASL